MTQKDKSPLADVSLSEWLTAALGFLLVIGSMGFLVYESVADNQSPPQIAIRVVEIRALPNGALVQFDAKNSGGQTAASVVVEGVLEKDGAEVESSETTLNYIPGQSRRGGGLFFDQDPRSQDHGAGILNNPFNASAKR